MGEINNRIWAGKVADSLIHIWKKTKSLEEVTDAIEGVLNGDAALAKARQEGRREGIEAMRDEAVIIVLRRYEVSVCEPAINTAAARLLAEGEKNGCQG